MPGRKPNHGLAMVSALIASRWSRPQSQKLSSLCWPLMHVFSWAHQLKILEILYSSFTRLCFKRNPAESRAKIWRHNAYKQPVASAAVHSLVVILSLLNAHNFITRWFTSLIKFCIRIHFNIVQTLVCVKVSFGGQGYAEHQSGG